MNEMMTKVNDIAVQAGIAIMEIYNDPKSAAVVDFKADDSPLTLADQASHDIICKELEEHFPEIPILSEEGVLIEYQTRKEWKTYWLIDPLDGTKEFINRNGEFTVNIALIENKKPIAGVIYVPVKEVLYYGDESGAFKSTHGVSTQITINRKGKGRIAVRSKSHAAAEEEDVYREYGVEEFISVGSSLKFCMVAEGKADLYYRHGPTMEWDIGAGQAILEAAGGKVFIETSENPFRYNKENLLNGSFLCIGF